MQDQIFFLMSRISVSHYDSLPAAHYFQLSILPPRQRPYATPASRAYLTAPTTTVVPCISHCERSVSRVYRRLRFESPAKLSGCGRRNRYSRCASMRYIVQLMVAPLIFLVSRQCRVAAPSPFSFCQKGFAPSVSCLQLAPLFGVKPQDAQTKADHESHARNADADSDFRAGFEALLESVCPYFRR